MGTVDGKLADIRSLYIDYCEAYCTWKYSFQLKDEPLASNTDLLKKAKQIRQNILSKIQKSIKSSKTEECDRFTLIKSIILNSAAEELILLGNGYSKAKELSNESMLLLSPLMADETKHPMIVDAFIEATLCLGITVDKLNGVPTQEAKNCCLKNVKLYENFLKTYKLEDAWDFKKIFGITVEEAEKLSDVVKDYQNQRSLKAHISVSCYKLALYHNYQPELHVKYGLQMMFTLSQQLKWNLQNKKAVLVVLTKLIDDLIKTQHLKQANYLLGIAIYHSVQMIRKYGHTEDKVELKNLQGKLSASFASLGGIIVGLALSHRDDRSSRNEIEEFFMKNESELVVGTELMEDGAEVYVTQYPIRLLQSDEEIKNVGKKALKWLQRAETLITMFDDVKENLKVIKERLHEML